MLKAWSCLIHLLVYYHPSYSATVSNPFPSWHPRAVSTLLFNSTFLKLWRATSHNSLYLTNASLYPSGAKVSVSNPEVWSLKEHNHWTKVNFFSNVFTLNNKTLYPVVKRVQIKTDWLIFKIINNTPFPQYCSLKKTDNSLGK